mmetsp:Transcript_17135/g.33053  ORF Transcript_17135/g.33053 Transcript_17135/m.33053 type:complete len:124 (+) Transcript_17135:195-566(+)
MPVTLMLWSSPASGGTRRQLKTGGHAAQHVAQHVAATVEERSPSKRAIGIAAAVEDTTLPAELSVSSVMLLEMKTRKVMTEMNETSEVIAINETNEMTEMTGVIQMKETNESAGEIPVDAGEE